MNDTLENCSNPDGIASFSNLPRHKCWAGPIRQGPHGCAGFVEAGLEVTLEFSNSADIMVPLRPRINVEFSSVISLICANFGQADM
jgi:hypothetical protein